MLVLHVAVTIEIPTAVTQCEGYPFLKCA